MAADSVLLVRYFVCIRANDAERLKSLEKRMALEFPLAESSDSCSQLNSENFIVRLFARDIAVEKLTDFQRHGFRVEQLLDADGPNPFTIRFGYIAGDKIVIADDEDSTDSVPLCAGINARVISVQSTASTVAWPAEIQDALRSLLKSAVLD